MSVCFYHPDSNASAACVQCGVPLCAHCANPVGEKAACPSCYSAVQSRVQQTAVSEASAPSQSPVWSSGPALASPLTSSATQETYKRGVDSSFVAQTAGGLALGLVFGIIAAIVVFKVLFYAHFGISYLYIAIGYGIGFGIHKITHRGGPLLAMLGVAIMIVSLLVGHLSYAADLLQAAKAHGEVPPGVTVFDIYGDTLKSFGFMHWICVVIGVGACYRAINAHDA